MKKVILILVSGLLITCMAGSALAFSAEIYTSSSGGSQNILSNPINLKPGDTVTVYLGGSSIPQSYVNQDFTWIKGVTGAAPATKANTGQITITVPNKNFKPTSNSYIDPDPITVHLDEGAPEGASYSIEIGASRESEEGIKENSVISRIVKSIPEFPTVALPVAAIVGILFIVGDRRKK